MSYIELLKKRKEKQKKYKIYTFYTNYELYRVIIKQFNEVTLQFKINFALI